MIVDREKIIDPKELFEHVSLLIKYLQRVNDKGDRGELEPVNVKPGKPVTCKPKHDEDVQFMNPQLPNYQNLQEFMMIRKVHQDDFQFKAFVVRENKKLKSAMKKQSQQSGFITGEKKKRQKSDSRDSDEIESDYMTKTRYTNKQPYLI